MNGARATHPRSSRGLDLSSRARIRYMRASAVKRSFELSHASKKIVCSACDSRRHDDSMTFGVQILSLRRLERVAADLLIEVRRQEQRHAEHDDAEHAVDTIKLSEIDREHFENCHHEDRHCEV